MEITSICRLFGIDYPIFQGGMAHVGTAPLVAAVSNAGALGIIGCGYYRPEWVRDQIRETRKQTSRPFGINIPLTSPFVKEVIAVILQEGVEIITTGNASPEPFIHQLKQAGMKIVPVVNTVSAARHVAGFGVDAVVAEGMESGGHIGQTTTMALVPQVVDAVNIPVIAAGGFADGRGLAAALALGARGIQMGTRFVCSTEAIAHINYKQKIIAADDRSTVVTGQTTGLPLRALRNSLTDQYQALESSGLTPAELQLFSEGRMYQGIIEGDTAEGSLLAGQIAGLVKDIKPVRQIIQEIIEQADNIINRMKNKQWE